MIRNAHPGGLVQGLAGVLFCVLEASVFAGVPNLPQPTGEQIELRVETDATVLVTGLGDAVKLSQAAAFTADDWRDLLHIVARDPDRSAAGADLPPLLGRFALQGSTLRFEPRFPPAPGLVVEVRFDTGRWTDGTGAEALETSVRVPHPDVERNTKVEAVYPAAEVVPANLLRFYVQFSAPMSARHVLPHIALLDEQGMPVETAFVEVEGGLWDPERTRLTLFVHPGRVKRGVGPNQALGPVLEAGKAYTLRVEESATDDFGRRLVAAYEHAFQVGPEDRTSPDPETWTITPPRTPNEPLRVDLMEPADVALLQRMPLVVDTDGGVVQGRIDVAPDGSSFLFEPESPWASGTYELRVPSTLEDASGNRVGGLFEERRARESSDDRVIARSFVVR